MDKVLFLTRRREKYLVVAAVRFFRTILSRHVCDFIFVMEKNLMCCRKWNLHVHFVPSLRMKLHMLEHIKI